MNKENNQMFPFAATIHEEFNSQLNQLKRFTKHPNSIGRYVELLTIRLLKKYFPTAISFTSGFIQTMAPESTECSPQMDIICYDRINFPIAFDVEEIKVIPSKAVKGIVEIKSTMTKSTIRQILELSKSPTLRETPFDSRIYILSARSNVKPKAVYELFKEYYSARPEIIKFVGMVFSLDWEEMIVTTTRREDNDLNCTIGRILTKDHGISVFLMNLMRDVCGLEPVNSISNIVGPSLYYAGSTYDFSLKISSSVK
jgi:hypothetical protein